MAQYHMLAVFGAETARAPPAIESVAASSRPHPKHPDPQELERQEKLCAGIVEKSLSAFRPEVRCSITPGKGCGFAYEKSPYCSYATKNGVHIMFAGEVSDWPGLDAVSANHAAFMRNSPPLEEDDAHWLLDFYASFSASNQEAGATAEDDEEVLQKALQCLSNIKGSFAFVVYDSLHHRVLAARDAQGAQNLYWGATDDGQLLFGSTLADLAVCNPSATAFPQGTLFASSRHTVAFCPGPEGWIIAGEDYPGELLSFQLADPNHWKAVRAIPRITSKGAVNGHVYKVSSQADMAHPIV